MKKAPIIILILLTAAFCTFPVFAAVETNSYAAYGDIPPALQPYLEHNSSEDKTEDTSIQTENYNPVNEDTETGIYSSKTETTTPSVNDFTLPSGTTPIETSSKNPPSVLFLIIGLILGIVGGFYFAHVKKKNIMLPEENQSINSVSGLFSSSDTQNKEDFFYHALCQIRLLLNSTAEEFNDLLSIPASASQDSFLRRMLLKYLKEEHLSVYTAVNRLCLLSKGINPKAVKIDIHTIIGKSIEEFTKTPFAKNIHIQQILSDEQILLFADYTLLKSVFLILMENSAKYTEKPDSTLTIMVKETSDQQCFILFKDDGIGMPAQTAGHLMEYEYFRGINQKNRGIGLGLFYASEIIKAHNGKIWFKSGLNKGFEVHISLPLPIETA